MRTALAILAAILAALVAGQPAAAQSALQSNCIALAGAAPGVRLQAAAFGDAQAENVLRLRFVDHATFLLRSPRGVVVATDFAGQAGLADLVPDVVTMNNYHHTHWTPSPDPRIPHVLHGWPEGGRAAEIELQVGDVLVRNITTDTRGPYGEGALRDGNSVFLFEVAGLCIAHLGHLHQMPTPEQYAAIGRVDVLMVPVDGGYTMDLPHMVEIVRALRPRILLPMHWFSGASLERFIAALSADFAVIRPASADLDITFATLPARPQIVLLPPTLAP